MKSRHVSAFYNQSIFTLLMHAGVGALLYRYVRRGKMDYCESTLHCIPTAVFAATSHLVFAETLQFSLHHNDSCTQSSAKGRRLEMPADMRFINLLTQISLFSYVSYKIFL